MINSLRTLAFAVSLAFTCVVAVPSVARADNDVNVEKPNIWVPIGLTVGIGALALLWAFSGDTKEKKTAKTPRVIGGPLVTKGGAGMGLAVNW